MTQEKHNFAQLKSIDLSLLDSEDPAVVDALVQKVKIAIRDDGFLFLEDYGVSLDQVSPSHGIVGGVSLTEARTYSSIGNSPLLSICITTSQMKIKSVFFSTPTPAGGPVTNTLMDSRCV